MKIIFSQLDTEFDIPNKLYHATFNDYLPSIRQKGLLASGTTKPSWPFSYNEFEKGVYLADDPDLAYSFTEVAGGDIPLEYYENIIVLEIDSSQLDLSKLDRDPNSEWDEYDPKTFIYRGNIPFSAITNIL